MREIKFRVWCKVENCFLNPCIKDGLYISDLQHCIDTPENFIVTQYIGLKDKNGKEIYDGDILKGGDGLIGHVRWLQEKCAFVVRVPEPHAYHNLECGWADFQLKESEIIGNIYENPDLVGR